MRKTIALITLCIAVAGLFGQVEFRTWVEQPFVHPGDPAMVGFGLYNSGNTPQDVFLSYTGYDYMLDGENFSFMHPAIIMNFTLQPGEWGQPIVESLHLTENGHHAIMGLLPGTDYTSFPVSFYIYDNLDDLLEVTPNSLDFDTESAMESGCVLTLQNLTGVELQIDSLYALRNGEPTNELSIIPPQDQDTVPWLVPEYWHTQFTILATNPAGSGTTSHDVIRLACAQGVTEIPVTINWDVISNEDPTPAPATGLSLRSYPNPMRDRAEISYSLPAADRATLTVCNLRGERVRTISTDAVRNGVVTWDGRNDLGVPAPSGVYLVRLDADGHSTVAKTLLLR
jgi:hypothetical protein